MIFLLELPEHKEGPQKPGVISVMVRMRAALLFEEVPPRLGSGGGGPGGQTRPCLPSLPAQPHLPPSGPTCFPPPTPQASLLIAISSLLTQLKNPSFYQPCPVSKLVGQGSVQSIRVTETKSQELVGAGARVSPERQPPWGHRLARCGNESAHEFCPGPANSLFLFCSVSFFLFCFVF